MRKIMYVFANLLILMMVFVFVVSCGAVTDAKEDVYYCDLISAIYDDPNQGELQVLCERRSPIDIEIETLQEWSINDLGEIIVAAGIFWEDWWYRTGRFASYNTGYWLDQGSNEGENAPMYSDLYLELMPSSGFNNISDVRAYLSQFYCAGWININIPGGFSPTAPFAEYNNLLYLHGVRHTSVYIDWETATHNFVSQGCCWVLVETTVSWRDQEAMNRYPGALPDIFDMQSYFMFIDGRINKTSICPIWRGPVLTQIGEVSCARFPNN